MSRIISRAEVAKHCTENDIWIVIGSKVFDVSKFAKLHPGGKLVMLSVAGKDATKQFVQLHDVPTVLRRFTKKLQIGVLPAEEAPEKKVNRRIISTENTYGSLVPYCEPSWYQDWTSPYYTDAHRRLRTAVRAFVEKEISPFCGTWDTMKKIPRKLFAKAGKAHILGGVVGCPWPTEYAGHDVPGGSQPEEFNYFSELIIQDEIARCGSGGVLWALIEGLNIGLPPVLNFGSKYLKDLVCPPCLAGDKIIALGITEPAVGSDVANLTTTAKRDGDYYIVNGEKKWITNGVFCDYMSTAVRTGGPGKDGVSLLLVPMNLPGVKAKQMQCSGVWASGTAYITMENVRVPVANLIGEENKGFKVIMKNFNHERWGFAIQSNRLARVCIEDAIKFARKRKTFGKTLLEHPVIRNKLAHMIRKVEATHAWIETITLQMDTLPPKMKVAKLAGATSLLKAQASQTFEFCAREASQILGGRSYTRSGEGERIERLYREVRAYAIPAGSEEIMLDLGVRQMMKYLPISNL